MSLIPGTPEYKAVVKKKERFSVFVLVITVLGVLTMLALIWFGIPETIPAKRLTVFILLCFAALIFVASLSLSSLRQSVRLETELQELKNKKEEEQKK
ncbi:MAG: hypothetical protein Q8P07_03810 [bacterium]|nr:hypothetical protein [bacterium]